MILKYDKVTLRLRKTCPFFSDNNGVAPVNDSQYKIINKLENHPTIWKRKQSNKTIIPLFSKRKH